jgi:competence protein ComEA
LLYIVHCGLTRLRQNGSMRLSILYKTAFKKYRLELILLAASLLLIFISFFLILAGTEDPKIIHAEESTAVPTPTKVAERKQFVEVGGAVLSPNIYSITANTRLKEIIDRAGGLTTDADRLFFVRNFNLARIVQDQEKYYIPSYYEVSSGYYQNSPEIYENPLGNMTENKPQTTTSISINNASVEELDSLAGVGLVTAQKIIEGRPYIKVEDLLDRKILRGDIFTNVKEKITL